MSTSDEEFVIGIAFDIEATGGKPITNAMVELGAVALNIDNGEIIDRFSIDIQMPVDRLWDERCLREFWNNKDFEELKDTDNRKAVRKETYERLQKKRKRIDDGEGEEPKEAMTKFVEWNKKILKIHAKGNPKRIKFMSDTASFDTTFVNVYLDMYVNHDPLHIFFDGEFKDVMCTSDVAQGLSGLQHSQLFQIEKNEGWYNRTMECRKALKIPDSERPDVEHNHDAVSDAQYIGQEHVILLKYVNRLLHKVD